MAGDWLHMRVDLPEDPAVIGIADRLERDVLDVVGRLYAVWRWFDQQTSDGQMKNLTRVRLLSEIGQRTRCEGFGEAMSAEGWLGPHGIPKFERWMGESAKKRLQNTRHQGASRSRKRVRELSGKNPDKNLTRVEESRVEESRDTKETSLRSAKKSPRRWRRVPAGEDLTPKRILDAAKLGVTTLEQAREEWEKLRDHEFAAPKSDVDATWRNWVRKAAEKRRDAPKPFPSAADRANDSVERISALINPSNLGKSSRLLEAK